MSIKIIKQPDVHVTESEYQRYLAEYRQQYMFYSGTPPTLDDFIRARQRAARADGEKT